MSYHTPFVNGEDADQDTFNLRAGENGDAIDDVLDGTLTQSTPTVTSFTNAQHDHADAAGGGLIPPSSLGDGGGSEGDVLQLASGVWVPAAADLSVLAAKGDLATYSSTGPGVARQPAGANGLAVCYDSTLPSGLKAGGVLPISLIHVGVKVYNSANQNIGAASTLTVAWNSEIFDDDGFHDTGSNTSRLTAQDGGRHFVWWGLPLVPVTTGSSYQYQYSLKVNGSSVQGGAIQLNASTPTGIDASFDGCNIFSLNAGDYVEIDIINTHGSIAATLCGGAAFAQFGMSYLGTG
jgi:hypothetical protein